MELLGSFYSHLDLENHGIIRRFYWNLYLDSTSGIQVGTKRSSFFKKFNIYVCCGLSKFSV